MRLILSGYWLWARLLAAVLGAPAALLVRLMSLPWRGMRAPRPRRAT
jgi:hypothetical protein